VLRFSRRRFYIAIGVLGTFWASLQWMSMSYQPAPKPMVEYWAESGLQDSDLMSLIDDQICQNSERQFLACMNALGTVLSSQKLILELDGHVRAMTSNDSFSSLKNEKKNLQSWNSWIREDALRMYSISFEKILSEQLALIPRDKKRAAILGQSINAYLSILKDPHTYLLPVKYYREVLSQSQLKSVSYGLNLAFVDQALLLKKVQKNSQAERVGLQKGDRILKVNQKDVRGLSLEQVVEEIKSSPRANLRLKIDRKGQILNVSLQRKTQSNSTVELTSLPVSEKAMSMQDENFSAAANVGLLTISKFGNKTCELVKSKILSMGQKISSGLVIDLRDNPGGAVDQAACVASLFVGAQKLFTYHYMDLNQADEEVWGDEKAIYDGPVSVLINSGTASAAELLAGSLRSHQRASLVGERTFGKGSFQEGEVWAKNSRLLYFKTLGLYYLPNGETPQVVGLQPDVEVKNRLAGNDREGELYMYPLQDYSMSSTQSKNELNLKRCLSKSTSSEEEDAELTKALNVLDCQSQSRQANQGI